MACFHPKSGWLPRRDLGDGLRPVFRRPVVGSDYIFGKFPCGNCEGCRLDTAREWGLRAAHEAQMHERNCFVTLTYDQAHLPFRSCLRESDWHGFLKALRNEYRGTRIRYLAVGEYGSKFGRPHFHACLFGLWFDDARRAGKSQAGFDNYESATLTRIWGKGRCVINVMSAEIAQYAARYSLKKVGAAGALMTDPRTGEQYMRPAEFMRVSTKPGLGRGWFERFGATDVVPHDYVITHKGQKAPVPRYYLRLLREWCEDDYQALKDRRVESAMTPEAFGRFYDALADRLSVREEVTFARLAFSRRGVE